MSPQYRQINPETPVTLLSRLFRDRRSSDPALFGVFLGRHASFVAQKTVYDYCRVKAGRDEDRLFKDPDFKAALNHCRWQVYFAVLVDIGGLAEAWLRPQAPGREAALAAALDTWHRATLTAQAVPEDERETAEAALLAFPGRIAAQQLVAPPSADRRPLQAEAPLFATLPVHPDQRRGEAVAIRGALRFHIVSAQQEMERLFVPGPIAAILTADRDS